MGAGFFCRRRHQFCFVSVCLVLSCFRFLTVRHDGASRRRRFSFLSTVRWILFRQPCDGFCSVNRATVSFPSVKPWDGFRSVGHATVLSIRQPRGGFRSVNHATVFRSVNHGAVFRSVNHGIIFSIRQPCDGFLDSSTMRRFSRSVNHATVFSIRQPCGGIRPPQPCAHDSSTNLRRVDP